MALTRRKDNPEARMSLGDHLRELRRRITISAIAIFLLAIVGWVKYQWFFDLLQAPVKELPASDYHGNPALNFQGITGPFSMQLNIAIFVGLILASPVWLWQIWRFIVPGLTGREKRVARLFLVAAVPLFLFGCAFGYWVLKHAVSALLSFTPQGTVNLLPADTYLSFVIKLILACGVTFLLPVFLVGLNIAGVLSARAMLSAWRPAVMVIFVFAAFMTPTPDPWSMLFVASPMIIFFFSAIGVCWFLDRRRAKNEPEWMHTPDDQASPI